MVFSQLTKGSILMPLRPIDLKLVDDNEFKVVATFGQRPICHETVKIRHGDTILLLSAQSMNGVLELRCLVGERAHRMYLKEEEFNEHFAIYPSELAEQQLNLDADEEWLTRYFDVRGKLFYSTSWHRPQVIFKDYEKLKKAGFLESTMDGKFCMFRSDLAAKNLGQTKDLVVGHAIRIRPGNRNLVFQFYHPKTGCSCWWEFNQKSVPKKKARSFSSYWSQYYSSPSYDDPASVLYMKRLFTD